MTYSDTIKNIMNNILARFNQVYHSVELVTIDGFKIPAAPLMDEYQDLSPTDEKEIIYIRKAGDDNAGADIKIGSCSKSYKMSTQFRIVFFKDHAENHTKILADLMQIILLQNVKLNRVITDKWKLQKDESSGSYRFGPKTAYFALDITVGWDLISDSCENDYCIEIDNPACLLTVF